MACSLRDVPEVHTHYSVMQQAAGVCVCARACVRACVRHLCHPRLRVVMRNTSVNLPITEAVRDPCVTVFVTRAQVC